ncbi:MAG: winged helix-turn-helix domain-containing protein [Armatimonadetes bacterium]|nr:winged helix-turn-helix domain-containing protein [Armatimonadota bacterium]
MELSATDRPILVADGDARNRRRTRQALEAAGFAVIEAGDGPQALDLARIRIPALLILSTSVARPGALEVCRHIRRDSDVPILMLLARRDEVTTLVAFAMGVDDCVALPVSPAEIVARSRALLRRSGGSTGPLPAVLSQGPIVMDLDRREVTVQGRPVALTPLEFRLLKVFMQAPGRAFSREHLLALIHAFDADLPADRTVDNLVVSLRRKLGDRAEASRVIVGVRGVGYKFMDQRSVGVPSPGADHPLWRWIVQAAPLPILVIDRERTVVLANRAAERITGWPVEQITGQTKCHTVIGCQARDGCSLKDVCVGVRAMQEGASSLKVRYRIDTGETVSATYVPLPPDVGSAAYCMIVLDMGPEGAASRVSTGDPLEFQTQS